MAMQAFMDESTVSGEGVFVLGGCIATAGIWAKFVAEWEELLGRFGRVDDAGRRYFHMTEMRHRPEDVMVFYRAMERHIPVYLSCAVRKRDLQGAIASFNADGGSIDWNQLDNPYYVCFRLLMDQFHMARDHMAPFVPVDETVDFYFEENSNKTHVRRAWDDYMANRPEAVRERYGNEPRFERDGKFLPLQAADFWAWWVRKWEDEGKTDWMRELDFETFRRIPSVRHRIIHIRTSQDDLTATFHRLLVAQVGAERVIRNEPQSR